MPRASSLTNERLSAPGVPRHNHSLERETQMPAWAGVFHIRQGEGEST